MSRTEDSAFLCKQAVLVKNTPTCLIMCKQAISSQPSWAKPGAPGRRPPHSQGARRARLAQRMASRGQARRRPPRRRHRHAPLLRLSADPSSRQQRGDLRKLPGPAAAPWAAGGRRARPAGAWRPRARAPTPPAAAPAAPRGVSRVAHADHVGALQLRPGPTLTLPWPRRACRSTASTSRWST